MIALLRRRFVAVRRYHHYDEERIAKMRREPPAILSRSKPEPPKRTLNCTANPDDIFRMTQTITKQISDVEKRIQSEIKTQTKLTEERFVISGVMQFICVVQVVFLAITGSF